MDGVKIDEIEISSRLLLTYDGVPLGHGVSQLARHPKVRQLGVTLHIEQNVASLEEIKIVIRSVVIMIITLMSLWIFFLRWRYSRPLSVSQITVAISSSVNVFFRDLRRKVLSEH